METMIVDILVSLLISKGIFLMLHYIKCEICCKLLAGNHLWKIEFSFNSWITIHFTMNEYWKKNVFFCRAQKSEVCIIWIQSYHLYYSNSYFLSFSYLYWNIKKKIPSHYDWIPLPSPFLLPSFLSFFFPSSFPPSLPRLPVDCRKVSGT